MSDTLQIAFPKVDTGSKELMLPEEPVAPVSKGLATVAETSTPATREQLSCKDLLQGDTLVKAQREAADLLEQMLENPQIVMIYGLSAMDDVSQLMDRLLEEGEPIKVAAMTKLMQDLNDGMREIEGDFNMADPKIREKLEKWKGGIGRFFGNAKTMIEMLMESATSIEKQLDHVAADLTDKREALQDSAGNYALYYRLNEEKIGKLIYVIGVMEIIRDLAAERAESIEVGNAGLGDRRGEQKAMLAEFASGMDRKIVTFKSQLWIAWSNAPRIRMMMSQVKALANTVNESVYIGIPSMKACIVDWREAMKAQETAQANAVVRESLNHWLQQSTEAVATAAVIIAEEVNTPPLTPETIFAMAKSIDNMSNGIVAALQNGAKSRQELDKAIMASKPLLDGAAGKVSDEILDQVLNAATKLEITTSVS